MSTDQHEGRGDGSGIAAPGAMSAGELVKETAGEVQHLVHAQIALVKAELRADLKQEVRAATGLGAGTVLALTALTMLFVAAALALAIVLPGWAAGLIVAGVAAVAAGVTGALGWRARVRAPLSRSRAELKEEARWTKGHLG